MKPQLQRRLYRLGITTLFALSGVFISPNQKVLAQLTPDSTLGSENSIVNKVNEFKDLINGGAARGANLFHSFQDFNIDAGKSVYFANPVGIENILTRVTGNNISNILGKLGLEGTANLFLINPNGIFFSKDASLDIRGSFTATTADSIKLGKDGLFNAVNPPSSNLLTVQPGALFVNALKNQQAEIKNEGNLQVGKNLTFNADNLNLSGTLQAGNNLTLQANNTLKIRDSLTQPFIASSGKNLLVQGNQNIDIFALNHADSGLFSGADMVLRSDHTVNGDAHYWSGGNFRIEQLDGSLGNLSSPNDPVIKTNGDVYIEGYQGASLHIWATGKVEIPSFIWIQGADTANGLTDTVTLSNSNFVDINGKIEPTLDIRAGLTLAGLGTPTIITDGGSFFAPTNLPSTPSNADITIGTILFANSLGTVLLPGKVLLTNQYQPNSSLAGNITVTDTFNGALLMGGNAGTRSVTLDSKGAINLNGDTIITSPNGMGGNMTLLANSNINSGSINASGGVNGSSGNITLTSKNGDISLSNASIVSNNYGVIKGGDINLTGRSLFLTNASFVNATTFGQGDAGNIKITTTNAVKLDSQSSAASQVSPRALGNAGGVEISTKSLELLGGSYLSANTYGQGNAGNVKITATDSVKFDNESVAESQVISGAVGNAGGVEISTKSLELLGGSFLAASTFGQGDAGSVKINTDSIKFDNQSYAASQVVTQAVGNAGGVEISTNSLELLGGSVLTASTFGQGNAGSVKITATDSVKFDSESNAQSLVVPGAVGNAGGVEIYAKSLELLGGSYLSANTYGQGNAGNVKITATDSVKFDNESVAESQVISGAVGNAGGVEISTKSLELLGGSFLAASTFGQGDAGSVKINTDSIKFDNQSYAASQVVTQAVGNAGGVEISTNSLELLGGSVLTASTFGQGNAGSVKITATDSVKFDSESNAQSLVVPGAVGNAGGVEIYAKSLELLGGSYLSANTYGQGNAGNVNITANNVNVTDNSIIRTNTSSSGNAGDILVNTSTLNLTNGGQITAFTKSSGNGGTVILNALNSVNIGEGVQNFAPVISVETSNAGKAGDIIINTPNFTLSETARITATATATATNKDGGGSIILNASKMNLAGTVGIFAETQGQAPAGTLQLNSYNNQPNLDITLFPNSTISASTSASGKGGDLILTAPENINITGQGKLAVESTGTGDAGNISINSPKVRLQDGIKISASSFDSGKGGSIIVNSPEFVLLNQSSLLTQANNIGAAGDITINTPNLTLSEGSKISASNQLSSSGNINLQGLNTLEINNSDISASTIDGKAGSLQINSGQKPVNSIHLNQGSLTVEATGKGDSGNLIINTRNLTSENNSDIGAATDSGKGGNINFQNLETMKVDNSEISASTKTGTAGNLEINFEHTPANNIEINHADFTVEAAKAGGNSGNLSINARTLKINASDISARTISGKSGDINFQGLNTLEVINSDISASTVDGQAGNFNIDASESVRISGTEGLAVEAKGQGSAGNLNIQTSEFNITDGANISASNKDGQGGNISITAKNFTAKTGGQILTSTSGNGKAGNINLKIRDNITLDGTNTGLFANTEKGSTGDSGSIEIDPKTFMIKNGAGIGVNSQGSGKGGNIAIQARRLSLNNKSFISAETTSNQGGEISLVIPDLLLLRNNSHLTATAGTDGAGGNGGNININTPFIVGFSNENSDITTNAFQGNGGKINITTNAIFGLKYRPQLTSKSDITASSQFGLAGDVQINTPAVDPTSGLVELSANLVDAQSLVGKDLCADQQRAKNSSFVITGKGGLAAEPDELISNSPGVVEWANRVDKQEITPVVIKRRERIYNQQENANQLVIQQAQGWIITADGKVILTSEAPKVIPQSSGLIHPGCHLSSN